MNAPKRTVLFDLHQQLGARMTEFGGFAMPVQYSGIIEEHVGVRAAAGVFDLSHMGEFEVTGPHALALLERALTNSAARLTEGHAQYTIMCTEDGGTIDDLIVYRLGAERYMLCVNASNIARDREWLVELNQGRAEFKDESDATALVAVQGPRAVVILERIAEFPIGAIARFGVATGIVAGARCVVARTGYTGEDGFELFVDNAAAVRLFEAILDAGASEGIKPVGLGARDTLRLEASLPLYGHELDAVTSPLEAGLKTFVKLGRDFVGATALQVQVDGGTKKHLVGIQTDDGKIVARQGYKIFADGSEIGAITSGTFAPWLGRPIAMAYASADALKPSNALGHKVEIEVRGKRAPATIVKMPFYRRGDPRFDSRAKL
jgi:aminomethyltransferase